MDGAILFFTIIISLIIGYSKGLNKKRKKINIENQELKEQVLDLEKKLNDYKHILGEIKWDQWNYTASGS